MQKSGRNSQKPHQKLPQGHVAFQLLCSVQAGYAVIGQGGSVSRKISRDTGITVLRVEDPLPGCGERIVYVVGPSHLERTLILQDYGGERKFEVSPSQEALIRVLEVLEKDPMAEEGLKCCRLLTVKGKEKIKSLLSLENVVGASVRVLPVEEFPVCAELSDDLIQISGDSLAVKKALLAVTFCLQGNISKAISQFHDAAPSRISHDLRAQKHLSLDTDARDGGQSRMEVGTKEVAFRLLCSTYVAGGLIGWGGSIVKAIEKETGAGVKVSDPIMGCTERVVKVFAMENKEWQNSPAQDATLRVFYRLMEAASKSGHASGLIREEPVIARLLISSSQANMIDMKDTAGAEVQMLGSHCSPVASVDEKVMQIVGDYSDVHICLLQVTWTLRDSIFSSKKKKTPLLPHEMYVGPHYVNAATTIADEIDNITVSCDTNKSSPAVLSTESPFGRTLSTFKENQSDVMASSTSSELSSTYSSCPDLSGDECAVIRNEEVEIVVPAHVFGHVYGEGGGNLAILRQISGATVIVHDPCPGADGKVIICGTPNQTMAAKSMLYAFIMSKYDCVVIK